MLGPEGYVVLKARRGQEGIAIARREQPALVILDLLMPEVDGFEVVKRLRPDPVTAGASSARRATMAGELILVVEDNEKTLKLVRDLVQFNGCLTLEATTAEHGPALAAEQCPRLILMDIQLPDIDGVAALGRLRADPRTAAIPIVALTAFAMKEDRERFLGAGFDGYLGKPIDIRAFPAQVRAFVEARAHPATEQLTGDGR